MAKTNLSIRIDDETRERLDALAARSGRNRSFLIEEALRVYLDHEAWLVGQIELGKDAAASPPVEHSALLAAIASVVQGRGL